jgi:hypothetical protein
MRLMFVAAQYSIAVSGMELFRLPIRSTVGGITIDLASAPLAPGVHELRIESTIGGVEIYVPSYVAFTFDVRRPLGGCDVHDGLGWIERAGTKLRRLFKMPKRIPNVAPEPSAPVAIRFVIDGVVGGVDVYRLAPPL